VAVFCNRGDWSASQRGDEIIELIEGNILTNEQAMLAGRYRSDELQSTYDLTFRGDVLTAVIRSPYTSTDRSREFRRASDGSYLGEGATITFEQDGQRFTLSGPRIAGISFTRLAN
jgi:hypothetical protein